MKKRIFSIFTAMALLFTTLPVNALAVGNADAGGLCEHHPAHTAECGYAEGAEGTPCNHEHTEDCYALVEKCIHEHTDECYPEESVSGNTATPGNAEEQEPTECAHECSEESGCIVKELDCQHEHDDECGYAPVTEGTPCGFVCEECNAELGEQEKDECICDASCTEEIVNADCPVCGVEDADLTLCKGEPEQAQNITITSFDELPEEVQAQIIPIGTKLADLNLPDTLGASGYAGTQDSEGVEPLTIEGVTWESDPPYDENAEQGAWLFTAKLPESYALLDGVELPQIGVMAEPVNLLAEGTGDFTVEGGQAGTDYSYADNTLTILSDTPLTISGATKQDKIVIQDGITANITIKDLYIQSSSCAFEVAGNATCNLTLEGENTLKSGHSRAGLEVKKSSDGSTVASLIITENSTGRLNATGGDYASGIGHHDGYGHAGNITIQGGTITAKGSWYGAGVGGHRGANVIITGGVVTANGDVLPGVGAEAENTFSTGADGNAIIVTNSIGQGDSEDKTDWRGIFFVGDEAGKIYGNGGSITLTSNGEIPAGKLLKVESGETITIGQGATLTNNGVMHVEGTISGSFVNNGTIYLIGNATIPNNVGGTIIRVSDAPSGLIVEGGTKGTDYTYENNVLTVKTGTELRIVAPIKTTVDKIVIDSACTGNNAANIILDNVNIDLSGTDNACAFEVQNSAVCNLTLAGASTLKSGKSKAGLQVETGAELTITCTSSGSGKLTANGGSDGGAGIGGGKDGNSGTITIKGGTISANGNGGGAGIGGGSNGSSSTITIRGGTVSANGSDGGAGIGGGGTSGGGGTIVIEGDAIVTAQGSKRSDAIGGGRYADPTAIITIRDNAVIETHGHTFQGRTVGSISGNITLGGSAIVTIHRDGSEDRGIYGTLSSDTDSNAQLFSANFNSSVLNNFTSGLIFTKDTEVDITGKIVVGDGASCLVYGEQPLDKNVELQQGGKMVVYENGTLTVNGGVTLTNNGEVKIENNGTLVGDGTIDNKGKIINDGAISGSGTLKDSGGTIEGSGTITITNNEYAKDSTVEIRFSSSTATYGDTIKITANVSQATTTNSISRVAANQVEFFVGTDGDKKSLGTASVINGTAELEITLSGDTWKNGFVIGENTITAEYGGSLTLKPNDSASETLSVGPKEITDDMVIWPTMEVDYTGTSQKPVVSVRAGSTDLQGNTDYTISYSRDNGQTETSSFIDAGKITVTVKGKGNYAGEVTKDFTIKALSLTIKAKDQEITYGNNIQTGIGQVEVAGLVNGETLTNITLTASTSDVTPNGTIAPSAAVISGGGAGNYNITYENGNLKISKAIPTYTAPTAKTLTYTGGSQELVSAGNTGDGELQYALAEEGPYSTNIPQGTDARDYTVWYKVVGDQNHQNIAAKSVPVTIDKAPAPAITWPTANGLTYGQQLSESVLEGGSTAYGKFEWQEPDKVPPAGNNTSYPVVFNASEDTKNNYLEITTTTKNVTVNVAKAEPDLNMEMEISGDGNNRTAKLTVTVNGVPGGDKPTETVKLEGNNLTEQNLTLTDGTASYQWTGLKQDNYQVKATYSGDQNYSKKEETIDFDTSKQTQSIKIAEIGEKTYGDEVFQLSLQEKGAGNGDVTFESSDPAILSISGTTATIHKAGQVTITATKAEDGKFNGASDTLSLSIDKRAITVTADSFTIVTGAAMPTLTWQITSGSLAGTDRFTTPPTLSTVKDTNTVGEHDITISGGVLDNGDSYRITYAGGKLIVADKTPVQLTLTANPATLSGGGSVTLTLTGLPSGGTATVSCSDSNITVSGGGTSWKATLPNETAAYTFTANYSGDAQHTSAEAACTVSVTRHTSGGDDGNSGGNSGGGNTGGNSGGGDSGGSTIIDRPTEKHPDIPTTSETKPVKPDKDGNVSIGGDSIQDAINKAAADAKKNGNKDKGIAVTVPVNNAADAGSLTITIPAGTLDQLVAAKVRRFDITTNGLPCFSFTLDTLEMLDKQSLGGDLILRLTKTTVTSKQAKEAIDTRPAYDIALVFIKDGKETPFTDWQGKTVSVKLPYTPAKDEQTGNLYAVYVDAKGKVEWLTKSSYNADQKAVIFEAGHFSVYGVGYKNPAPVFTDITGHWAADNIIFAASRGLLAGTGNNQFSPNTGMTRGMFVTALGRLAGIDPESYKTGKFTDVKADAYYAPYVNWAAEKGIISGTSATTFSPDTNITREQMAVIMAGYAKKMGYDLPVAHEAVTFADNAQISSWAAKEVKAMQQAGIMAGKGGNRFDPKGTATRAEVATVLRRFVEIVIDPQTAQGWVQDHSGSWQYMKDGKAVTGWLYDDKKWYWLDKNGRMFASGWKQISGKWYYFYSDGSMAVNTTIDGHTIGPDGARK